MLGGSCSPCCSQCKPLSAPASVEIDITSSQQDEFYAWTKYRTGRQNWSGECETNRAMSYFSKPITSGTYVLTKVSESIYLSRYTYSDEAFVITAEVSAWQGDPFMWGWHLANRSGPGVYLTVSPMRLTQTQRSASVSSGADVQPQSLSDMQQQSPSIDPGTAHSGIESGVAFVSNSDGRSGAGGTWIYGDVMQPCFGGIGSFNPIPAAPWPDWDRLTITHPPESILPLAVKSLWRIGSKLGATFATGEMTDDMGFLIQSDDFPIPNCGRVFNFPYFQGAGGSMVLMAERTPSYVVHNQPWPVHLMAYGATITRDFTITAMRGIDAQGGLVQLL